MNSLQSPPSGNHYIFLFFLINIVNKYAREQVHTVVEMQTKTSNKGIVEKCILKSDQSRKLRDNNATSKHNAGF